MDSLHFISNEDDPFSEKERGRDWYFLSWLYHFKSSQNGMKCKTNVLLKWVDNLIPKDLKTILYNDILRSNYKILH